MAKKAEKAASAKTFILNDETQVNSYGFRIPNSGIDLSRFDENPVMLAMHYDSIWNVIGRWVNLRVEGSLLLADAEFDIEDPVSEVIAGKVERGFIKACSMGVLFAHDNLTKAVDEKWDLGKCELMEASIVAIPSNANAVRLFAATGELMEEEAIKLCLNATILKQTKINQINNQMEKFKLNAVVLMALSVMGLKNPESESEINASIEALADAHKSAVAELAVEKKAREALQAQLGAQKKAQAEALVDGAVAEGKITADLKASFVEMAENSYEMASKVIGGMAGKASLAGKVNNQGADASEVKSMEEFQKLTTEKQLAFKANDPDGYAALFA